MQSKIMQKAREGLWQRTPGLFVALGLCPALAVTTAAINGFVMGMATTTVLTVTALIVLAIRSYIPREVRIPVFTVIISSCVTVVDLVLSGLVPAVHSVLGLFVPLIIVNCLILGRVETSFTRDEPVLAITDALGYGLGFTWALTLIGAIREMFASGTFFGISMMPEAFIPWGIMRTPPGAFLTMGLLVAIIQALRIAAAGKHERRQEEAKAA